MLSVSTHLSLNPCHHLLNEGWTHTKTHFTWIWGIWLWLAQTVAVLDSIFDLCLQVFLQETLYDRQGLAFLMDNANRPNLRRWSCLLRVCKNSFMQDKHCNKQAAPWFPIHYIPRYMALGGWGARNKTLHLHNNTVQYWKNHFKIKIFLNAPI